MSTKESLVALRKTFESLKQIQETLKPFLDVVHKYHEQQKNGKLDSNRNLGQSSKQVELFQITEAETAIALSIGTLRYMALRLKGRKGSKGDGKNDPLRLELDKIRKTLVELRKLKKKIVGPSSNDNTTSTTDEKKTKVDSNGKHKRKISDQDKYHAQTSSPKRQK